ncbi:MAG TPA: hypothetical protein PLA50_00900 [Bacteroidia bacterium]|nr:hypothetical protein [Bacteroidia bacterium]
MGRKLKRVPMDFDWPLDEVWGGYLNPHWRKCPDCEGGYTASYQALDRLVHLIMIAGRASLVSEWERLHPWLLSAGLQSIGDTMHELTAGLAGRACHHGGHDASDRWTAVRKIITAAGLPEEWGICRTCDGESVHPSVKDAYESWEPTEPPAGDGYQLWETTTEGSPVSPVFGSLEALCEWAASNATTFGRFTASAADWMKMLQDGHVQHREGNLIFM